MCKCEHSSQEDHWQTTLEFLTFENARKFTFWCSWFMCIFSVKHEPMFERVCFYTLTLKTSQSMFLNVYRDNVANRLSNGVSRQQLRVKRSFSERWMFSAKLWPSAAATIALVMIVVVRGKTWKPRKYLYWSVTTAATVWWWRVSHLAHRNRFIELPQQSRPVRSLWSIGSDCYGRGWRLKIYIQAT